MMAVGAEGRQGKDGHQSSLQLIEGHVVKEELRLKSLSLSTNFSAFQIPKQVVGSSY